MGNMAEENGEDDPVVTLQPFVHQVGGHTQMLLLDSATICKPLNVREMNFYRNIPPEIKPFSPAFKGVIQVGMLQDGDVVTLRNVSPSCSGGARSRSMLELDKSEQKSKTKNVKHCLSVQMIPRDSSRLNRLIEKSENSNENYFLLLENVASKFYRPCILDLKMGKRQHGDDAPEAKRKSHIAKCAASTSASLGVRLCGMQVYQADTGAYIWKNKYFGRQIDDESFKHTLHDFFHNGFKMRTGIAAEVIERLKVLRKVVEKKNSFRFYSSSLLILYEGCSVDEHDQCEDSFCDSELESSGSWDMESANQCRHHHDQHHNLHPDSASSRTQRHADESNDVNMYMMACGDKKTADSLSGEEELNDSVGAMHVTVDNGFTKPQSRPPVDVRMIDFAHTTYEGYMGDQMVHRGPDTGYLFGLDNLIRLLQDILDSAKM
ncbi:hypothetical protein CHUAL_007853 [Chamberlinius hualienensis]